MDQSAERGCVMGRNSKAKQAANQQKIVQRTVEGKTQTTIAEELGIHPVTVCRNLAELRKGFMSVSREEFSVYVKQQVELLTKAIEEVWEGKLPPEAANSIRGLMDSIARLTGSNAPTKSIHANVNADVDPGKLVGYRKFLYHTRHLSEADVNAKVFPFCDSLPSSETPQHLLEPSEDMKRGFVQEN
jgi:hypothetical protein